MQRPWSMYNRIEKLRVDDLKPEHVKIILLSIPNSRMHEWYACLEGDLHWQPIGSIPEFYEDVRNLKGLAMGEKESSVVGSQSEVELESSPPAAPKPAPASAPARASAPLVQESAPQKQSERRPLFEDAHEDMLKTDPTLMVDTASTKERRTARRYQRNLTFKVIQGGKSFQAETEDISMAGLSLKEKLPEWVPKNFRAEISSHKNNVRVLCVRVGDTKLKLTDADSWDVIRAWLVNW